MKAVSAFCAAITSLGMFATTSGIATAATVGSTIAGNHPKFSSSTKMIGAVEPASTVEVTIWLNPHNKAEMDSVAKDLYDPKSPNFRHFLKKADFMKRYAPTADEAKTVANFFTANKMSVVKMGPDNFYVRASGTAAAAAKAFHVTLNNYEVNGKTFRANVEDPYVSGEASSLVYSVSGLDTLGFTHPMVTRMSTPNLPGSSANASLNTAVKIAPTSVALAKTNATPAAASTAGTSSPFNSDCFVGQTTQTFTSTGGALPKATYSGNEYTTANDGCGYVPADIYKAYGLNALYAEGFNGKGQTIVILDWCGSPTIQSDANAFSAQFGLPPLTSENFQIIYTPTASTCEEPDAEINLDVEWAHAIAPGAAIDLVVPPSSSFQDIDEGLFYAIDYGLGSVISNSYGAEEIYLGTGTLETGDLINETGAILGISVNYASGDDGDYTFDSAFFAPSASYPATSPYGTAIGGISLGLNKAGEINWQIGWGTNENLVSFEGDVTDNPSQSGYFNFGSGGGPSVFFDKPSYQSKLSGSTRQVPDISWLADPFTGVYIGMSNAFQNPEYNYEVIGGTSLACPMFSALWAISAQEVPGGLLGQAAPYVYSMPKSTISDIVPYSYKTDITGVVEDGSGKTKYTAVELGEPVVNSPAFISVLWDYPLYEDTAFIVTFGTDSGLTVAPGWDDVTGVGVPKPKAFADYFANK